MAFPYPLWVGFINVRLLLGRGCTPKQVSSPKSVYSLREFGKLPSSWPPARVGGGSALTPLTPFPADPPDPQDCSKIDDFIEKVIIFGPDGWPLANGQFADLSKLKLTSDGLK